jgi:hypothetical protein
MLPGQPSWTLRDQVRVGGLAGDFQRGMLVLSTAEIEGFDANPAVRPPGLCGADPGRPA